MISILDWHNWLLDHLLAYRTQHPNFTFWLRQRDRGDRLSNGYWFQGNDNYIFLSFWARSGGTNMTRSMGFVVHINEDGSTTTNMQVVYNNEKDNSYVELYQKIIARFKLEKLHKTKYILSFLENDPFKSLDQFLTSIKPDIDQMIREAGKEELFISEEQFNESIDRINELRKDSKTPTVKKSLDDWIAEYKRLISGQLPALGYNELYKWETVQNFQDHWRDSHNESNILMQLKTSFNKENNNLWSGQRFFPYLILVQFAEMEPGTVSNMFHNLYDESIPLSERFSDFYTNSDELLGKLFPDGGKVHYQSDRVLMLYLALRYPHIYFLYKSKMFETFCELTNYWEFPRTKKRQTFKKVEAFIKMCMALNAHLKSDSVLLDLHHKRLPVSITFEDDYHLLTQDFIYSVSTYLNNTTTLSSIGEEDTDINTLMNLNQILFGPPGTGKTYHTVTEAVRIADPKYYETNQKNRVNLKERFRELLIKDWANTKGQIAFCTFHQSFSYEDFVEGIKPLKPQENDNYLKYNVEAGIFKKICQLAEENQKSIELKTQKVVSWSDDTFKKAVFYKISLGDASKDDDLSIYEYCLKNNCIALGYGGETDFTGLDEEQIINRCKELGKESFTEQAVNRFIHYLKTGNYVLISNGNRYVRAIGKVIGPYKYDPNTSIRYKHFRQVEWIVVNQDIPVTDLYDRYLSQQTIYKMDEDGIKKEFFVNNAQTLTTEATINKNFVLVIDEINRGNISSIFGELITLIEVDKRAGATEELQVTLPYSKEPFKVPSNVYIIGTMNTADRSIEALDTALRRRFSFKEMPSKPDLLTTESNSKGMIGNVDLMRMLITINQRIEKLIDKDHQIGHAYFMDCTSEKDLQDVFHDKVIPLLQEYFFGDFGKIGLVLGDSFVEKVTTEFDFAKFDVYDSSVRSDLKERPVYNITAPNTWNFQSIYA